MQQPFPPDSEVEGWLKTLGLESFCQWDVLVFLDRHQASLVGADYLACLLGHAPDAVVAALDTLESLGFVERSRVSQGARLYQVRVPPVDPRGQALTRLLALGGHRAGRLLLSGQLRRADGPPSGDPPATRGSVEEAGQVVRAASRWSQQRVEGRETWSKAI